MCPAIHFRFIRPGHTTDSFRQWDDFCSVTRVSANQFNLRFRFRDASDKVCFNTALMGSNDVCLWVRRALDLLDRDTEPFEQFQVDFPLLPSIMFDVKNIWGHYHAILDATEFSLDNWPGEEKAATPQAPAAPAPQTQNQTQNHSTYHYTNAVDSASSTSSSYGVQTRSQARRHAFYDE